MRLKIPRAFLSIVAATAIFSLSALPVSGRPQQGATLTATGSVTVNELPVSTGATFSSGSIIFTGADGDANIDLGPLGRLQLRPNTRARLTFGSGATEVQILECGSLTSFAPAGVATQVKLNDSTFTEVSVSRGEVYINQEDLKGNRTGGKRLKADKRDNVYNTKSVEARRDVETVFTVNCCQCCFNEVRRQTNK